MKRLLNAIGSLFVYKSPKPYEGFARFLVDLPSKQLRSLADTNAHCSKKKFVKHFFERNNVYTEIQD